MNNIPIFDSLTHPTITGDWILPGYPQKSSIKDLLIEMNENNICNAFAVGMETIGAYNEAQYSEFIISNSDKLLPIAFFNISEHQNLSSVIAKLKYLKNNNYRGIKLHPRIGQFNLLHPLLPDLIKAANDENLVVLLCTYFYENNENTIHNNVENLLKLLIQIPKEKVILLHSGAIRLLEFVEIARAFNNILLDLSFTLLKYKGSSIDLDIQFAFNSFDKRLCIGSDFPQFSVKEFRERFNFFSANLLLEKAQNIAFKNIENFINL